MGCPCELHNTHVATEILYDSTRTVFKNGDATQMGSKLCDRILAQHLAESLESSTKMLQETSKSSPVFLYV